MNVFAKLVDPWNAYARLRARLNRIPTLLIQGADCANKLNGILAPKSLSKDHRCRHDSILPLGALTKLQQQSWSVGSRQFKTWRHDSIICLARR